MSNVATYKAYCESTQRQVVFMDGKTFIELLFLCCYDEKMFRSKFSGSVRYFVPQYSFQRAVKHGIDKQKDVINTILASIPANLYVIYDTPDEKQTQDSEENEDLNLAYSALKLREKYPNMCLEVSPTVWKYFRIASLQSQNDSDFL